MSGYTDLQPVSSSNIAAVGWANIGIDILEVEFLNGSLYLYEDIPESMFNDMMSARSHGTWFWDNIRRDGSISYYKLR